MSSQTKNILKIFIICLLFNSINLVFAGDFSKIRKGNWQYNKKNYQKALEYYESLGSDKKHDNKINFNIGNIHYKKGEFEDAVKFYEKALDTPDIKIQAKAYFNIGNAEAKQQKFQEALDFYKKSLALNPTDRDAKFNYEFVQKLLKDSLKQQNKSQQNQQDQKNQKNQQQDKQEQGKDKQSQEQMQNKTDKNKNQEQKKEEQNKQNDNKNASQQEQKQDDKNKHGNETQKKFQDGTEMTKEEAERLLDALSKEDKRPKNENKEKTGYGSREKDW